MTGVMSRVLVLVCAAGLALACETQEPATEQGSETTPVADPAAAREAIAAVDQAWENAATAADAAAIAALYTSDAIVLPPGASRVEGTAAIQEMFGPWLTDAGISSVSLDSDVITVSSAGDMAHAVGSYAITGMGPDGSEYTENGKYVEVLRNVDGEWKIAVDIWNADGPPAGTESMTAEPEAAPAE